MNAEPETYSESAEGVQVSQMRALQEIRKHGFTTSEDANDFFAEMGTHDTYNAGDVLRYLGY